EPNICHSAPKLDCHSDWAEHTTSVFHPTDSFTDRPRLCRPINPGCILLITPPHPAADKSRRLAADTKYPRLGAGQKHSGQRISVQCTAASAAQPYPKIIGPKHYNKTIEFSGLPSSK